MVPYPPQRPLRDSASFVSQIQFTRRNYGMTEPLNHLSVKDRTEKLFFFKRRLAARKAPKRLQYSGPWALAATTPMARVPKVFCFFFSKKKCFLF
jgi:hypothetical protein